VREHRYVTIASGAYRSAIERGLMSHGFERRGRVWERAGPDLVWLVEVTKTPSWRNDWCVDVGIAFAAADDRALSVNGCPIQLAYCNLGDRVPASARATRFNDHQSYFTMILHTGHDQVTDDERLTSLEFIGADLRSWADEISSVDRLRDALTSHCFESAFVHRDAWSRLGRVD
jgi:hypothetical protein